MELYLLSVVVCFVVGLSINKIYAGSVKVRDFLWTVILSVVPLLNMVFMSIYLYDYVKSRYGWIRYGVNRFLDKELF